MFSGFLALLGSSAMGSLLGGVFAFLNKKLDMQTKVQDQLHEAKKWEHDLKVKDKDIEYAQIEATGKKEVAFIEGEAVIEAARMKAIESVSKEDNISPEELAVAGRWKWLLVAASAYRKSMRSILTTAVGGAAIVVNVALVWKGLEVWPTLDQAQKADLILQALAWISAQASMMFGYWFVSRGSSEGRAK